MAFVKAAASNWAWADGGVARFSLRGMCVNALINKGFGHRVKCQYLSGFERVTDCIILISDN